MTCAVLPIVAALALVGSAAGQAVGQVYNRDLGMEEPRWSQYNRMLDHHLLLCVLMYWFELEGRLSDSCTG